MIDLLIASLLAAGLIAGLWLVVAWAERLGDPPEDPAPPEPDEQARWIRAHWLGDGRAADPKDPDAWKEVRP
jgi:hypothetical protein